jgi:hypothetical protein
VLQEVKMHRFTTFLFAVILLSSCSGRRITNADIFGTWVPDQRSKALLKSTNQCQLVFQQDGTVRIPGVPDSFMKSPDQAAGALVSGRGRWSLAKKNGSDRIALVLSEVDGQKRTYQSSELTVELQNGQIVLFYYIGEEGGTRFVFERASGQAQSAEK